MKKAFCFLLFSCFLIMLFPEAADGAGFSLGLRFYGGLQTLSGGDLNSGMSGISRLLEIQAGLAGLSVDGSYKDLRWSLLGGGDLIVHFAPWIGLEIGGGYGLAARESVISYSGAFDSGQWTVKPSAAVVPVRAGLSLLIPLGSGLSLSAHGGAGYYLATVETFFRLESESTGLWSQETQKATAKGIGFHGGLGLEIRVARFLALLIEGQGRLARLDGFEGDLNTTNSLGSADKRSGTLYHFQVNLPPGLSQSSVSLLTIFDTLPSGAGLSAVRPARVDFGGFGAAVGFVIRL